VAQDPSLFAKGWEKAHIEPRAKRYAQAMANHGEFSGYALAVNDLTGATQVMEAATGVDIAYMSELSTTERWSRGLQGGGQLALTTIAAANQLSHARARLQGFNEFHYTESQFTSSIKEKGLNRPRNYLSPEAYSTGGRAAKKLGMYKDVRGGGQVLKKPDVLFRVKGEGLAAPLEGPQTAFRGTGTEIVRGPVPASHVRGPYPMPVKNAATMAAWAVAAERATEGGAVAPEEEEREHPSGP